MEARSRAFEPVKIEMTSVETAYERFHKNTVPKVPGISFWRVNLTALSQRHNLYFVATREKIQVYRPGFPYQTLGDTPALTISPQLANPVAEGYIDPDKPHSINHLLVGDLGNQEILLLSTDSGNVVAYNTGAINAAVKKDAYRFSTDGNADFVGVRPFFSQWVHESAWGLAIHSEGRMVAVSANTPHHVADDDLTSKITVFAFALTLPNEGDDVKIDLDSVAKQLNDPSEWRLWSSSAERNFSDSPKRDCNYKIVLSGSGGHSNNVPCVAFVNGPEDASGSWLLSTDITGQMKMWEIWKGKCFKTWNFTSHNDPATPWTRHREAGWQVAALDIHAFRSAETMDKFIGHKRARQYYGYHAAGDSYDLTDIVERCTPQSSGLHPFLEDSEDDTSDDDEDELNDTVVDSEGEINNQLPLYQHSISTEAISSDAQPDILRSAHDQRRVDHFEDEMLVDTTDNDDDLLYEEYIENTMEIEITGGLSDDEDNQESPSINEVDRSPVSGASLTSASSYNPRNSGEYGILHEEGIPLGPGVLTPPLSSPRRTKARTKFTNVTSQSKAENPVQIPQVPIIHCSTSHVRLFKGPTSEFPHIFCARMLRQVLPTGIEHTNFAALDRLSMIHQIPELGIVLIASQMGRCAICTLTKRSKDGLLGYRVDWILPTRRQEREGKRPANQALLGIAASPIQGHARSKHAPLSEHDTDQNWARDRVINGMRTTFDPEVVVLRTPNQRQRQASEVLSRNSTHQQFPTEHQDWARPKQSEGWRAYESSRRYRLMLTYTDSTVLTYELSRSVEQEDMTINSSINR